MLPEAGGELERNLDVVCELGCFGNRGCGCVDLADRIVWHCIDGVVERGVEYSEGSAVSMYLCGIRLTSVRKAPAADFGEWCGDYRVVVCCIGPYSICVVVFPR